MSRLATIGLVLVVSIATVFWYRSKQTDAASADILDETKTALSALPGYAPNAAYIDGIVERAHAEAMKMSYDPGMPRTRRSNGKPESFDDKKYLQFLVLHMQLIHSKERNSLNSQQASEMKTFMAGLDDMLGKLGIARLHGT